MARNYVIVTDGERFATLYVGEKLSYGWHIYAEGPFATKDAAQEWLLSELEAWRSLDNPRRRRNPLGKTQLRALLKSATNVLHARRSGNVKREQQAYEKLAELLAKYGSNADPADVIEQARAYLSRTSPSAIMGGIVNKPRSNPASHWWYLEVRYDDNGEPTKSWRQTNHAVIAESAPEKATKWKRWKRGRAVDSAMVARDIEMAGARRAVNPRRKRRRN